MFLVGGCDPGGPGHGVPAPDDVDDGGEARGDAHGEAQGQKVVVAPQRQAQNVAHQIQTPGDQIENCNNI